MNEFFAMGGYAFYVWGAYGVAALVILVEVLSVRSRRRAVHAEARLAVSDEGAR
jgi:heme exporter protein D